MPSVNKAESPVHTELLAIAMQKNGWTSMHSSRMRTARLLTVSHRIRVEVSAYGGCLPRRCVSQHAMGQTSPPLVDRITDRCKNITFSKTSFAGGKNFAKEWVEYPFLAMPVNANAKANTNAQCEQTLKVCSHLPSAFEFASTSLSMVMQTQTHRMGLNPFSASMLI